VNFALMDGRTSAKPGLGSGRSGTQLYHQCRYVHQSGIDFLRSSPCSMALFECHTPCMATKKNFPQTCKTAAKKGRFG